MQMSCVKQIMNIKWFHISILLLCCCFLYIMIGLQLVQKNDSHVYCKDISFAQRGNKVEQNITRLDNVTTKIKRENIGILIPSTTRMIEKPILSNLSLTNICLPSIYESVHGLFNYRIYIGIDDGDYLQIMQKEIEHHFNNLKTTVVKGRTFTHSVNAIARKAYNDGMDYLVRINDDTSFETKDWITDGIRTLRKFQPPNIGVVGPTCEEGNTKILTHDMVHRTHLEIFDFYYPPYFDNWYADDWITEVYKPNRVKKLKSWIVQHHMKYHKTRYKQERKIYRRLQTMIRFDRDRLKTYLLHYFGCSNAAYKKLMTFNRFTSLTVYALILYLV